MPPEYSDVPELAYDWMIAAYFFLGGLSAGSFLFSVATTYWKKELRPLGKPAAILAPVVLAVGMVILLVDLGQPTRAYLLFTSLNPTSALSWAAWLLNVFAVLSVLYAFGLIKGNPENAKKFAYAGVTFAILVAKSTGMLPDEAPGRPSCRSALTPDAGEEGTLVAGIGLAFLISAKRKDAGSLAGRGQRLA